MRSLWSVRLLAVSSIATLFAAATPAATRAQEKVDLKAGSNRIQKLLAEGRYAAAAAEAEALHRRAEIQEGKESTWAAVFLDANGMCLQQLGQYQKAELLHARSLAITEAKHGPDHTNTAAVLNNLATLHYYTGHYQKAEQLGARALAVYEAKLGPDHNNTATVANLMANVYTAMGLHPKAEPLYARALAIKESRLGTDHPETAVAVANLGNLYAFMEQYQKAEPLFLRALAIKKAKLGPGHPETAVTMNTLGTLYRAMGKYQEAESIYTQSLAIKESKFGPDHPETAITLSGMAGLYKATGQYPKAESLYARAVEIYRARLSADHPTTARLIAASAALSAARGRTEDAARAYDRSLRSYRRHAVEILPVLADRDQLTFLAGGLVGHRNRGLVVGLTGEPDAENRLRVAGWLLNSKAVAAESMTERILLARDADTAESRKALADLDDLRRQLARLTLNTGNPPAAERVVALKENERRLAASLASSAGHTHRADPWYEPDELRRRLPEDCVYIDVARFPEYDFKAGKNGPTRYAAVLSFRSSETRIVDLGPAAAIEAAVKAARAELETAPDTIREKGEREAEKQLKAPLTALANLVLEPLKTHVADKPHWVVSPDASLWLVPWAALPLDDTTYVLEKHRVQYVVSGRDLLRDPLKLDRRATAPVVVADPDFDLAAGPAEPALARGLSKDFKLGNVRRLPGTAVEAEAILPHLEKLAGAKPVVLTDAQARTAAVRAVKSPRVFVLSTHGFFLEDEKPTARAADGFDGKPAGPVGENPLLRCGLLFAGCNRAGGADTGVLTGLEVVGTDLRGTQLVVLSACETGLGDVRTGEGVAGLRQAFQLAGAESVVATLWQVPDRPTAQLMIAFFTALADAPDRAAALAAAQRQMVKQRRAKGGAAHPYFWAAFTLTGRAQ